jgi:hypothetical protein
MQILSGVMTVLSVVLSGVIGVRLLRRSRGVPRAPEKGLALFFLCTGCIGSIISITLYSSWADPALRVPDPVAVPLLVVVTILNAIGTTGLCLFNWWTFRQGDPIARWVTFSFAGLFAAAFVWQAVSEGFAIVVIPGPAYWLNFLIREAGFVWVAYESLRHAALATRRVKLGLSDPLVANRFLLIGVWGASAFLLGLVDLGARVAYVMLSGESEAWIPEVGRPVVSVAVFASSTGLSVAIFALFMSFFPTRAWRRRIAARAAARA